MPSTPLQPEPCQRQRPRRQYSRKECQPPRGPCEVIAKLRGGIVMRRKDQRRPAVASGKQADDVAFCDGPQPADGRPAPFGLDEERNWREEHARERELVA